MKKLYFLLLIFSFFTTANAQIVNIPDANFRKMLLEADDAYNLIAINLIGNYFKIDANSDGQIQIIEAQQVRSLRINYSDLYSIVGIQSFINLQDLQCDKNNLTSLNLTGLTSLKILNCSYNRFTSLNFTGLTNLKILNCSYNEFMSLNVTNLTNLEQLQCTNNKLSSLNVTGLINLKELVCDANQLTFMNVTGLTNLQYLSCDNNKFASLNISGLINLKTLDCSSNQLISLDATGLTNLYFLDCYNNQLSSLNMTGLTNLRHLVCYSNKLVSLNLIDLINLTVLKCSNNQLTFLNVTGLINLYSLDCSNNQLKTLNVTGTNLYSLDCYENQLTSLNVTGLNRLDELNCYNNQLKSLNATGLTSLSELRIYNNKLETLFIKNGRYHNSFFSANPTLKYICVDDFELKYTKGLATSFGYSNCEVNSYCSFVPEGAYYIFQGNQQLDSNKNGCDENDILISNLNYTITSGATTGNFTSDTTGKYTIPFSAGTNTIKPILENPTYFTVFPTTVNVTFPTQTSPFTQNFCITPNGVRPDLEVALLPLQPARPGFDAKYKLVYKNKGNTIQTGSANLTFNDAVLDLVVTNPVATSQTTNNLTWNFTALQPFETREITFTMNVNSPMEIPAVNNGDILNFTTTITSSATDETPTDNTFTFNQTVVGSYDPNDKTCLEGTVITPALIGQYVHYLIRFENKGTFAAENVVIKDMIDLAKFDISTLIPTSASHSYITKISDLNKVEFIFEKINLPFDDANNDGYIAFKIKTKPTLIVNDSFTNEANIYFDYNFPILTNKATSTFKTLGTQDFDFGKYFTLYPNPAKADLNITAKETINVKSINVYNTLGQLVLVVTNADKVSKIDVSSLTSGNYLVQIKTDKGTSNTRFIKE